MLINHVRVSVCFSHVNNMICISIEHIECGCSKDSDTTQEEMGEEKEAIRRNLSLFYLIIIMIRSRKKKEKSSFAFLICYLIQTCLYIIYNISRRFYKERPTELCWQYAHLHLVRN